MDIAFVLGLIIGGLISWGITHIYYKKSSKEQETIYNKLSEEVRDAILEDNREKLSVLDLNQILEEKTIDPDSKAPLPYKVCPKCGSEKLKWDQYNDYNHDDIYFLLKCDDCGWGEVTQ